MGSIQRVWEVEVLSLNPTMSACKSLYVYCSFYCFFHCLSLHSPKCFKNIYEKDFKMMNKILWKTLWRFYRTKLEETLCSFGKRESDFFFFFPNCICIKCIKWNFCRSNIKQKIIFSFKDYCTTQPWILNRTKLCTSLSNPSVLPPKVSTSLSLFLFEFSKDCNITQ